MAAEPLWQRSRLAERAWRIANHLIVAGLLACAAWPVVQIAQRIAPGYEGGYLVTAAALVALEAMLAAAEQALTRADFAFAARLIGAVEDVLAARNLFFDPLAARYLRAVNDLAARGYEAQLIDLSGPTPRAAAIRQWPILEDIPLYNSGQ